MTLYYGRQLSQSALMMELPDLPRSKPGVLTVCKCDIKIKYSRRKMISCHFMMRSDFNQKKLRLIIFELKD